MSSASIDPSVSSIQLVGAQANTEALHTSMSTAVSGSGDGSFNGTIGDLQKKYPEVYQKVILQTIATQIVQQCQRDNDHYIQEMKKRRDS